MAGGSFIPKTAAEGSCDASLGRLPAVPVFVWSAKNGPCHGSICGWEMDMCILIDDTDYPPEDDVEKVVICG